jgi:uroporphyrinogen-III synthase
MVARVLVPPSRPDLNPLATLLARAGLHAIELPHLDVSPPEDEVLAEAVALGQECDVIVFAGGPSASAWLAGGGKPGAAQLCAIGHAAESALRAGGLPPSLAPREHTARAVADAIAASAGGPLRGRTVLLLRGEAAGAELPDELGRRGARCIDLVGYRLRARVDHDEAARLLAGGLDAVALSNPSAVRVLALAARELGCPLPALAGASLCAAAGPATAEEARRHGLAPSLVIEPRDGRSLVALSAAIVARLAG